jgi:hypothetical protein
MVRKTGMLLVYSCFRRNGLTANQAMTGVYAARRVREWRIGDVAKWSPFFITRTDEHCRDIRALLADVAPLR